jgi:prepilin-type N-terminal cleavage/methylation domain-containing protein
MKRRVGFTLVELLTVIAIIAILTAILFPVFARAKVAAKRTTDISRMSSVSQALLTYRTDQGGFPPMLLNCAEYDPVLNQDRSVNQLKRAYLFPSRLKDADSFTAALNQSTRSLQVAACWPSNAQNPNQAYGPGTVVTYEHLGMNPIAINGDAVTDPVRFYAFDSMDIQPVRGAGCFGSQPRFELRYILFWTQEGQLGGGPNDDKRQLGYNDPPADTTVVTWNTYYRRYPQGNFPTPLRERNDIVLYLSGNVRSVDSVDVYERSFAVGQ